MRSREGITCARAKESAVWNGALPNPSNRPESPRWGMPHRLRSPVRLGAKRDPRLRRGLPGPAAPALPYCPKCKARIDVRGALQSGGSVKLSAPSKSATTGSRIAVVNGEKRLRRQSMTKSFDVDGARPGVSRKPQRGPVLPWGMGSRDPARRGFRVKRGHRCAACSGERARGGSPLRCHNPHRARSARPP